MSEAKLVRICWNINSWIRPSGPEGKSKNKEAYEDIVGYGHEEWLFDVEKIVDGFHYGFLQAANSGRNVHKDKILDVHLYSINSITSTRWWVGAINKVIMVGKSESEIIYKRYKELGWFDEMLEQLKAVGASSDDFQDLDPKVFVTVKFKPNDLFLESPPKQFSAKDPAISATYYNFQPFKNKPTFKDHEFNFVPGHNPGKTRGWVTYEDHNSAKNLLHNQIQNSVYLQLDKHFGSGNVGTEQITSNGTKVDVVVKGKASDFTFYEIKTSPSLLGCIREALPQLLEYAYFPSKNDASKLIIVSPNKINSEVSEYLCSLRSRFGLPIYYQVFDQSEMRLNPELY